MSSNFSTFTTMARPKGAIWAWFLTTLVVQRLTFYCFGIEDVGLRERLDGDGGHGKFMPKAEWRKLGTVDYVSFSSVAWISANRMNMAKKFIFHSRTRCTRWLGWSTQSGIFS